MTAEGQIVDRLTTSIAHLEKERDDKIAEIREQYEDRLTPMRNALAAMNGEAHRQRHPDDQRPNLSGQGISTARLDLVRKYMRKKGSARQADIAADLDLNSGAVSVAMGVLFDKGEVTPSSDKERGSRIWYDSSQVSVAA